MSKLVLALDKSVRHFDVDGRLHVKNSPISKACVSPYFGREIPNNDVLGLDPNRIYQLFRDPVELTKAAESFRGLPILIIHQPTSADDHPQELTVGAIGTEVEFNHPYLEAPLCIWTAEAIAGIETKQQTEISSGYRYTADMTPGEYEGVAYDGVMRNILGNHIALVEVGRAGPDVVVQDEKPLLLRIPKMATKKLHLSRKAIALNGALRAYLTPKLAQDAAIGSLGALLVDVKAATYAKDKPGVIAKVKAHMQGKLAADANLDDIDKAMDASEDDDIAEDADEDDDTKKPPKAAADVEPKDGPQVTKAAMDAAIDAAVTATHAASEALHKARKDVAPIVGDCSLATADAVYKFALDHLVVDVNGVHPSAYPAMLAMATKKTAPPTIAQDSKQVGVTVERFPHLSRIAHI